MKYSKTGLLNIHYLEVFLKAVCSKKAYRNGNKFHVSGSGKHIPQVWFIESILSLSKSQLKLLFKFMSYFDNVFKNTKELGCARVVVKSNTGWRFKLGNVKIIVVLNNSCPTPDIQTFQCLFQKCFSQKYQRIFFSVLRT